MIRTISLWSRPMPFGSRPRMKSFPICCKRPRAVLRIRRPARDPTSLLAHRFHRSIRRFALLPSTMLKSRASGGRLASRRYALHCVAAGSVHRCGCHRLAVLRQCGQTDYREVGAEVHPDFIVAGDGKPGAPRAAEPTYRSGGRGEHSASTTGTSGSDRPGRRRADYCRPVSRNAAAAPVDGARSRNRGARDRAAQGQY